MKPLILIALMVAGQPVMDAMAQTPPGTTRQADAPAYVPPFVMQPEPGLSVGTIVQVVREGAEAEEPPAEISQAEELPAAQAPPAAAPEVDESALRYFASRGDTRRLEIEIARLRALYPDWTPPADPLAVPVATDERLEAVWLLYSQGRFAEARRAIAERQESEPQWSPPADLLERLAVAEARERLVNASSLDQYETVIRIGSQTPSLLTCSEVDVLWRVAEAFAETERASRARDVYRYILTNCENPHERLTTIQNASTLLPADLLAELLELERADEEGAREFAPVRDDLARRAVAAAGEDETATVAPEDLARVERLAREGDLASDARLVGWYRLVRDEAAAAEEWFRLALEREADGDAAEGLALALIARDAFAEAEAIAYPWRAASDDVRQVYLAAAANLLAVEPRVALTSEVLARIVAETAAAREVATAQQLGWYARAYGQHETAGQWFATALQWDPADEASAYGLALSRFELGDAAGLAEIQRQWAGRSERIAMVGEAGRPATPPAPRTAAPTTAPAAPAARQAPPAGRETTASVRAGCTRTVHPESLRPESALQRGWCLMELDRPLEAAQAFAVALRSTSEATRRDAGYGQSLAYLRAGMVDEAAVAAASAPQDAARSSELQASILAERALGAFEQQRYMETLLALDQRAQVAAERVDLMILRGYAYLNMRRFNEARRVFRAAAGTGSRDALRGLAAVDDVQRAGF